MIKLNTIGFIVSGEDENSYIKILLDEQKTGGYYIFFCKNKDFSGEVFDAWVEDYSKLEKFFQESNWIIDWTSVESGTH
jgi:hypothetical protein